mgnify:FL=1
MLDLLPLLNFTKCGTEFPTNPNNGDVFYNINSNKIYINCNHDWIWVEITDNSISNCEHTINYTNCKNCGAPINPHKNKCEYCDTFIV